MHIVKNFARTLIIVSFIAAFAYGASTVVQLVQAFTGPGSQSAGVGGGAVASDSGFNLSIGSSTVPSNTKLYIVGNCQDDQCFVIQTVDIFGNPRFTVRADGKVGIGIAANLLPPTGSSTALRVQGQIETIGGNSGIRFWDGSVQTTAGGATTNAVNISAGAFGANTGGGNYSFPARVGIGIASPQFTLDMLGSLMLRDNTGATNRSVNITHDGSELKFRMSGSGGAIPINFSMFDVSALYINGNGNVGIGTASPGAKLHVKRDTGLRVEETSAGRAIEIIPPIGGANTRFHNLGTGTGGFSFQNDNSNQLLVIAGTGNVGIGTASPVARLHVTGTADLGAVLEKVGGSNWNYMRYRDDGVYEWGTGTDGSSNFFIGSYSGGFAQRITITEAGDVGIGTASPSGKLHVNNTDDSSLIYGSTGNLIANNPEGSTADVRLGAAWGRPGVYSNQQLELFSDTTGIIFGDSNVERMRLTAAGKLGIGTASPSAELEVAGWYGRTAHNNGGLVGSYNNVGANSARSNPIYVIGSSYKPADTTLSNMYGIGYSHTNASFITGNGGGWGMYVAADGDARIFLNGSNGSAYFAGNVTVGGGSGKLTVGTIDPVYTIGEQKYATYLPSMTGVKEETAGMLTLREGDNDLWSNTIDFDKLDKGSDLWIFYQTTDFEENWKNLTVLLTPDFAGDVWYEKLPKENKLIFYGSPATGYGLRATGYEVSYRLTANRFDWKEWNNVLVDEEAEGFVIEEK